jgi:plastocyanin
MRGRSRRRIAAAAGGMVLAALVALCCAQRPVATRAYVNPPQGARVLIEDTPPDCSIHNCYTPPEVSVVSGATVTWFNNTASTHTVTRCTPAACEGHGPGDGGDGLADSGAFGNGATYFFTFDSPGTYLYYCSVYGYRVMHGSVVVRESGPRSTPTPAQPFGIPLPRFPPFPTIPVQLPEVGAGHPVTRHF